MKLLKYIFIAVLPIGILSCSDDFLEPAPTSAISGEEYYSNDQELEKGVINMYDGLQGVNSTSSDDNHGTQVEFYVTEMRSDNTRTKSTEGEAAQFENYSIEATNGIVFDYYRSSYNNIYRANVVLENLDAASSPEMAAKFEGEAKFVRAYSYFNLVRLYGDIPLVDRVVAPLEKEIQFTRVSSDLIYDLIVSDLTFAANNLDNSNSGRASKAAAQALLAKVELTLGNYLEAQTLCEDIMSAGFSLEENFKDIFFNERNREIIFAIEYQGDLTDDSQNFSAEWLNAVGRTSGVNYVTDEAKEFLDEFGGDRTPYSYRVDTDQPTQHQVVKYIPDGDESLGIEPTSGDPRLAGNDWIVLRYADVLLMHVEAVLAGGTETSNAAALSSFQKVRDRAGLTDPVTSITKQQLLDERRAELAFENQRLFDLMRFGVAQEVLSEFSANNGYNFTASALLLPIPQAEINLSNGLLKQNPGY